MIFRTFRAVLALALLPGVVQAQDRRLDSRLPEAARAEVAATVDQATARGLPTEPLIQRALEGASRNASPARIVEAVRDLADRLSRARSVLGAGAGETELVAAAGALDVGYDETVLARLRSAVPGTSIALPLVTLTDLSQRGVPRDDAAAAVISLLSARVPDEAFGRFRQSVAQDIRHGIAPSSAVHARSQGVLREREFPPRGRAPVGRGPARPGIPRRGFR